MKSNSSKLDKKRTLVITDYCLTPKKRITRSGILFENEQILAIGGASAFTIEPGLEVIEFKNSYAMPGLIDAHIHGAGGFDSSVPDDAEKTICDMNCVLVKHGITSYVPTIVSAPPETMINTVAKLAQIIDKVKIGPDPVGIHLEGPFISKEKHGSQMEECMIEEVDIGLLKALIQAGNGCIKKMTFAPEIKGAIKLIEMLREYNIQPSMGHSMALEDDTMRAIDAGARNCTHLFNGMPDLHQRKISLTAIALTDSRVTVELILDGKHIHPRIIDMVYRCKNSFNIIGVSDANQSAGMKDGDYHIGQSKIHVENGVSTTNDGSLAGSTELIDIGWHSLMTYSHIQETDASACTTYNPAINLGLTDRGILLPGKRADIAIFERGTDKVLMTIANGRKCYSAEKGCLH
jgi:N-acetylglucosamine-6-phosphate deacetylase